MDRLRDRCSRAHLHHHAVGKVRVVQGAKGRILANEDLGHLSIEPGPIGTQGLAQTPHPDLCRRGPRTRQPRRIVPVDEDQRRSVIPARGSLATSVGLTLSVWASRVGRNGSAARGARFVNRQSSWRKVGNPWLAKRARPAWRSGRIQEGATFGGRTFDTVGRPPKAPPRVRRTGVRTQRAAIVFLAWPAPPESRSACAIQS